MALYKVHPRDTFSRWFTDPSLTELTRSFIPRIFIALILSAIAVFPLYRLVSYLDLAWYITLAVCSIGVISTIYSSFNLIKLDIAQKILQFPLTRMLIAMVLVMLAAALSGGLRASLVSVIESDWILELIAAIALIVLSFSFYGLMARYIERRPYLEMAGPGALKELGWGLGIGALLITIVIGLMWMTGHLHVVGTNPLSSIWAMFPALLIAGFIEELIIRGIVFKYTEELLGTWAAIVIQALMFGFMHAANDGATLWSNIAISVEAGILLAAVFMLTRRLWAAIGLHFAWNFVQGPVYGVAVSGHDITGLLEVEISGNELLSGGAFGAEASIFAVAICTMTGLYLLYKAAQREGNIISPLWIRGYHKTLTEESYTE